MFKLKDTFSQIKNKILGAVQKIFVKKVKNSVPDIEALVKLRFRDFFIKSKYYKYLTSGRISAELGLPVFDADHMVEHVLDLIIEEFEVKYEEKNKAINVKIFLKEGAYNRILDGYEKITTDKGDKLEWLHWLLEKGSKKFIVGYRFKEMFSGRSLGGIMVPKGAWGVPSEIAGTQSDNFITRLLEEFDDVLKQDILEIIKNKNV